MHFAELPRRRLRLGSPKNFREYYFIEKYYGFEIPQNTSSGQIALFEPLSVQMGRRVRVVHDIKTEKTPTHASAHTLTHTHTRTHEIRLNGSGQTKALK